MEKIQPAATRTEAAIGREEEKKAEKDMHTILEQSIIYDSDSKQWINLTDVNETNKAIVSLPRVQDAKKQFPPDLMIFLEKPNGQLLVCGCDVKSGSIGKAWQITRGRIFDAFANKGFWDNIAEQDNAAGNQEIIYKFASQAKKVLESTDTKPSQTTLDQAESNLSVGTGFFLTPVIKRDESQRTAFAENLDTSKGRTRLVISGAVREFGSENNAWLLIGKDEATRVTTDEPVSRVINIWGCTYTVERIGPPRENQTTQLKNEQSDIIKEFPTKEENQELYKFIVNGV